MTVKLPPTTPTVATPAVTPDPRHSTHEQGHGGQTHHHGQHKGAHFRPSPHGRAPQRAPSPLPRRNVPAAKNTKQSNNLFNIDQVPINHEVDNQSSKLDNGNFTDSDDGGREYKVRERLFGLMQQIGSKQRPAQQSSVQAPAQAEASRLQGLSALPALRADASLTEVAQRLMQVADRAAALGATTTMVLSEVRNLLSVLGPNGLQGGGLAAVRSALIAAAGERSAATESAAMRSIHALLPLILHNLQRDRTPEQVAQALSKLDVLVGSASARLHSQGG
jgi:hypothetical protein